jgi:OOP family OmpA-OmpF porin
MRRSTWCVPLFALAIAQAASAADDSGWYLGAGAGLTDTADDARLGVPDVPLLSGRTDDNKLSWSFAGGYRFSPHLAIELGYVDLGRIEADVGDLTGNTDARAGFGFSADGVTLALIGSFPIGKWEPYLKAGVFHSTTELTYSGSVLGKGFGARFKGADEDALYGVGVRYAVNERVRIYLDATYFMEVGEPDTGQADYLNFTLGVVWRF